VADVAPTIDVWDNPPLFLNLGKGPAQLGGDSHATSPFFHNP
jgi:hypothetical protein